MTTITGMSVLDIRVPTSRSLTGSDAMNPDPDNSVAYVVLETDSRDGIKGFGFTYSIGRGNDILVSTIEAMRHLVVGASLEDIIGDMSGFWRSVTSDGQLRWLGPEKGVVHLATAAIVNAVWDLWARRSGKPLWKLLVDLSPQQIVGAIDFRYIDDVLNPDRALEILTQQRSSKDAREAELLQHGYPAYNTSVGWLGFTDDKVRRLCAEAVSAGWQYFKVKVGKDSAWNYDRIQLVRKAVGWERRIMVDANEVWGVEEAISNINALREFNLWWIEEPTSPDDVLGHARIASAIKPARVATGELCHNRIMVKQLLQANAMQFCQVDACRLGGVNEVLAAILMCAQHGVSFCPHAGGLGIGELMQHMAFFDYVAVSGSLVDRVLEWVDHSHELFVDPARLDGTRYVVPSAVGSSSELTEAAIKENSYPFGTAWSSVGAAL